jgi:hypothetical protein
MVKIFIDGVVRDLTADEQSEYDARQTDWNNESANRKLTLIREIRFKKLEQTDYLANSDVVMPDNVKTWRQTLRDLPANHTDEAAYDALLTRDSDGNLTNSVWSKP